jgi:hypothetical protein
MLGDPFPHSNQMSEASTAAALQRLPDSPDVPALTQCQQSAPQLHACDPQQCSCCPHVTPARRWAVVALVVSLFAMYNVSGSTDGGHRAGVSPPSPHAVETARQRETVGHTHCECKSDAPVSTTISNMSSVITQANFGGEAAVGLVSGPVCFAGRSLHAHIADPEVISLGNRHQARFLHVLPMQMLPQSVNAPSELRSSRPILIADVCPSIFHVLSDVVPGLMGLLRDSPSNSTSAPTDAHPQLLPATVVIRSNCHVMHLGGLLFVLPFAVRSPLKFTRHTLTDADLSAALRGRVMVRRPASAVKLRLADADFVSPDRRPLVLRDDEAVCGDGSVVAGETAPRWSQAEMQRTMTQELDATLPMSHDVAELLWAGCDTERQYRVLVILRRNGRLLGQPSNLSASLLRHKQLCARVFYFERLPVLQQFFAARSAHAVVGQHGAALTFLNIMADAPRPTIPDRVERCQRSVIELWFYGQANKNLRVYERAAITAGMSYQLVMPSRADFFNYVKGVNASRARPANNSIRLPEEVTDDVLPANAVLERDPNRNVGRGYVMKKLGTPHFAKDFLQQIAYFNRETLDTAIDRMLGLLQKGCPLP